jgi:hypothetical protein
MKLRSTVVTFLFAFAINLAFSQVTPVEIIKTVAGNGSTTYTGDSGAAINAGIYAPGAVALDSSGNFYITDAGASGNSMYSPSAHVRKVNTTTGIITTVVGGGSCQYNVAYGDSCDGDLATSLGLWAPSALAIDNSGNLYVTEADMGEVYEVLASTQTLKRVAGNGDDVDYTGDGGLATKAAITYIGGIAFDSSNNLYIADEMNNVIREVNASTGIITTIAGSGYGAGYSYGFCTINPCYTGDGGLATSAHLDIPMGVAVDASGNIYFADSFNNVVRKVAAGTNIITTIAGNGYGAGQKGTIGGYTGDGGLAINAELFKPTRITLDGLGNLYISDYGNNVIRKVVLSTGIITTFAGDGGVGYTGDGSLASNATFGSVAGVAATSTGSLYIADSTNNVVREVFLGLPNPTFSPAAGTYGSTQSVSIADSVSGATIYYTTDGTTPSTSSSQYIGTIPITGTTTINAIATATGYPSSGVTTATYTIIQSPVISPAGGVFSAAQTVAISDASPGVTIYYTTNGTKPSTSSTIYTGPFSVSATATIEAIAVSSGGISSQITSDMFIILTVPPSAATYSTSNITSTSATLIGYVNPNGFATTASFAYGTSPVNLNLQTAQSQLTAGSSYVLVSIPVTGLTTKTTYFYQVTATSSGGSSSGSVQSFTTN